MPSFVQDTDYKNLIEPIRTHMTRAIWRIVRDANETEDVLQDALMQIVRDIDRIRRHPNPTALLLRICNNTALDHVRKRTRRRGLFERWRRAPGWPPESVSQPAAEAGELREAVICAIARLPRREGEAILLMAVEGLDYAATAEAMGCSPSTVRVLAARARKRLWQCGEIRGEMTEDEGKRNAK